MAEKKNEFLKSLVKPNPFAQVKKQFADYSSKVNWIVFISICVFTLGSWLDIYAIWSELTYLVDELPEGWRLPSILNLITQLAMIGPILFSIGRLISPRIFTYVRAIYFIFSIGIVSCILLAIFWNKTVFMLNERRSIYLYIFNFTLSLLDGMSTLTFLPYISTHFVKEYVIPNYIGESLSALIPGLFAIVQSIGVHEHCPATNQTLLNGTFFNHTNSTVGASMKLKPLFSVSVYFVLIMLLLVCCILSFSFLNYSKLAKNARKSNVSEKKEIQLDTDLVDMPPKMSLMKSLENRRLEIGSLLVMTFIGSFLMYGYLPGLVSYSNLPYGNIYFHLSLNLSSVLLPVAIFFSIWSYKVSVKRIMMEFFVIIVFATYIIVVSAYSPCPPLINHWLGGYLIVFSWVTVNCLFLRMRCLIAATLESFGHHLLFIYGIFTISGQVLGGILIYINVEVYPLFKDKAKCSPNTCL